MYKFVIKALLLLLFIPVSAQERSLAKIYAGTFTSEGAEGIYQCHFNYFSGEISLANIFKGIANPSFLKISPNKKYLYAVTRTRPEIEKSGGYINAYRIGKNGNLHFLNKQISHGADPCHVDVSHDGKFVAIANYGGGTTSLYKVNYDGSLKPAVSVIVNEGSGPNKQRQNAPHAHSIRFSPDGKYVFSADLGTDQLNIFELKEDKLIPAKQPFVKLPPGSGPRHFDFHPNGNTIFVINELNSTVSMLERKGKNWDLLQNISTIPKEFSGISYCADIHVSADGRFLYGSNRGHNSIAVFKISPETNHLEWVTSVSTHGDWPRNFTLSPDGKFLLVANQRSGNIVVFTINPQTGIPEFTGNELALPAPVCLEFM